jgi:formimidoylglutamate deiminase
MAILFQPDLLYAGGRFASGVGLLTDEEGAVAGIVPAREATGKMERVRLAGKALLPGMVNAHSHTFQRLIRGRSENRSSNGDTFWTWREAMYRAAATLSPEEVYAVARMTFLEMMRAGITTVGEFHYLHRTPEGGAYDDANLLAKQVVDAALSVGVRIGMLRSAYLRAGYTLPPHPGQRRFYETLDEYIRNTAALGDWLTKVHSRSSLREAWLGVAPHSIRAVPLPQMKMIAAWAEERGLPLHMHVAEQPAELRAGEAEYGKTPVALLAEHGLLSQRAVLVHAIHTTDEEVRSVAEADALICSCPTTERNLGDGVVDARRAAEQGVRFAFGTDSQAQIDLLEDARELDYHLRLITGKRAVLDGIGPRGGAAEDMSQRLFRYATEGGARAVGFGGGMLGVGMPADFFTVDLNDLSIAGSDANDLLSLIVFGMAKTAIADVVVGGRMVVRDREHDEQESIVSEYTRTRDRVWNGRVCASA